VQAKLLQGLIAKGIQKSGGGLGFASDQLPILLIKAPSVKSYRHREAKKGDPWLHYLILNPLSLKSFKQEVAALHH